MPKNFGLYIYIYICAIFNKTFIPMYLDFNDITIILDPSVKHITRTACMVLSGTLENGIVLANNPMPTITIYKDRVDFGRCMNPELSSVSGLIFPNFYKEYESIVYRFGSTLKCSLFTKTIDYSGAEFLAPETPDNPQLFPLLYPKFQ